LLSGQIEEYVLLLLSFSEAEVAVDGRAETIGKKRAVIIDSKVFADRQTGSIFFFCLLFLNFKEFLFKCRL